MKRLLIIEDDDSINLLLKDLLSPTYHITQAYSGTEGYRLFKEDAYDLILLDLMLPGMSGEQVIEKVRESNSWIPIIILTAKNEVSVLVDVLSIGASDYIAKPFDNKEVKARIEAQIRRSRAFTKDNQDSFLLHGCISMNIEQREITVSGEKLSLTQKEYELLKLFLQNPNKVFSKANLYESVWKEKYYGDDNTISVHISRLRNKLKKASNEEMIDTVWGIGFKLKS